MLCNIYNIYKKLYKKGGAYPGSGKSQTRSAVDCQYQRKNHSFSDIALLHRLQVIRFLMKWLPNINGSGRTRLQTAFTAKRPA